MGLLSDKPNGGSWTLPGAWTALIGIVVKLAAKLLHMDEALVDPITTAIIAIGVVIMAIGGRRVAGQIVTELRNGPTKKGD
jgi:hypothetical protein